jgi:hypothetical protein
MYPRHTHNPVLVSVGGGGGCVPLRSSAVSYLCNVLASSLSGRQQPSRVWGQWQCAHPLGCVRCSSNLCGLQCKLTVPWLSTLVRAHLDCTMAMACTGSIADMFAFLFLLMLNEPTCLRCPRRSPPYLTVMPLTCHGSLDMIGAWVA